MKDKLEKIKQEGIRKAIIEASKDLLLLADIAEIERDFKYSDFEGKTFHCHCEGWSPEVISSYEGI